MSSGCPVDHASSSSQREKCPVDHKARSTWTSIFSKSSPSPSPSPFSSSPSTTQSGHASPDDAPSSSSPSSTLPSSSSRLPQSRETSSIPRADGTPWVYPSEAQFFAALLRKQHTQPRESDMRVVVPIHNAVNERAWADILAWERGWGAERCGGLRLVSFKGRPADVSPRARWRSLLGYQAPFDRHDWVVDRCGTKMRYVIDFYTGKAAPGAPGNLAFFIDARPALDSWDAVKMRTSRFCERWFGLGFSGGTEGAQQTQAQTKSS